MLALPASLAPPAPFPLVTSALRFDDEAVAPGVRRATYRLRTSNGPLVVHVVAVDPRVRTVRLGVVTAHDALVSAGETVSSMARRTGAVAGINGDYFDIGQTNQPLNVVVQDGVLVRTPSRRYALDVDRAGHVRFDRFTFGGTVTYGNSGVPLTAVNEFPPQGGATLLTPAFGRIGPATGVTLARLAPNGEGTYRVLDVAPADGRRIDAPTLGLGPAAAALAPAPTPGDTVAVAMRLDPDVGGIACALGGGPLLVKDGAPFDDPDAPAPEERDRRFPVSGALTTGDGTLLLVAVDGRVPDDSVGLTRPEFGALMLAFGARDGLAFDSGGSATLAARVLGDEEPSVRNAPSDGMERPVADGLFVYSDAPRGLHPRLVVRPSAVTALPGASVALRGAVVDDAGNVLHPVALPPYRAPREAGSRDVHVTDPASGRTAPLAVTVIDRLTSLAVVASLRNPAPGDRVTLDALGTDTNGLPVALDGVVTYRVSGAAFDEAGTFTAGARDAVVVARAGGLEARALVRVGRHVRDLDLFAPVRANAWHFASAPAGADGAVRVDPDAALDLSFDFGTAGRAAYAATNAPLPDEPLAFALGVRGDGSGVTLRAAFVNHLGERDAVTLARRVDWTGWRRVEVPLPPDLAPRATLVALYVVPSHDPGAPSARAGTLAFRAAELVVPGTP